MDTLTPTDFEPIIPHMTDWLTVKEAADKTGYNFQHIRRLCRRKRLECVIKGQTYLIDPKSLDDYVDLMKRLGDEKHNPHRPWADD